LFSGFKIQAQFVCTSKPNTGCDAYATLQQYIARAPILRFDLRKHIRQFEYFISSRNHCYLAPFPSCWDPYLKT